MLIISQEYFGQAHSIIRQIDRYPVDKIAEKKSVGVYF